MKNLLFNNEETQEDTTNNTNDSQPIDFLKELGQFQKTYPSGIMPISIIGEIEGHSEIGVGRKATKYEHIIPMIMDAEERNDIKGVLLILNTMGGDVEAGLAISELVAGMSKPSVSLVVGGGHSIGVPLAVCTDYSYIVPSGSMIVHPIRMTGLVIGVQQSFEYFKKIQDRITSFITTHSKVQEDKLNQLMLNTHELVNDVGSILIGQQAVDVGIIDNVGGLSQAIEHLKQLIQEKDKSED